MLNKINNLGFSAVFILVPFVLIISISAIGLYVYSVNQNKTEISSAETNDKVSTPKIGNLGATNKVISDKNALAYLEFKNIGVKMALADNIKDAYIGTTLETERFISTHYFDNKPDFEGCRVNDESSGVLALASAKAGDDNFGSPWTEKDLENVGGKKIDDTYYWLVSGGAPCWNPVEIPESNPTVQKYYEIKRAISEQQNTLTKI